MLTNDLKSTQKASAMPKKTKPNCERQLSLLDFLIEEMIKPDGGQIVYSMLKMRSPDEVWRGVLVLPPGTFIEKIIAEFDKKSNIPLEIPFFVFFHFLAAYLLYNKISLKIEDKIIIPDIWTVVLANSGSGKSFVAKEIREGIPDLGDLVCDMSGLASNAAFIESLVDNNNKLYIRDDFSEMYKQIQNACGPLSELKDTILRLFNNDKIERKTKKESIIIEKSAIVFLGLTVEQQLSNILTAEDIFNGFAQRFSFIIADKDRKKKMIDYPIWNITTKGWLDEWKHMVNNVIPNTQYTATAEGEKAFKESFKLLCNEKLDESFYRRQLWKATKYALLYHIILGKGNDVKVGAQEFGWAARVMHLMINDCLKLLEDHGMSEIESKAQKVESLRNRLAAKGQQMTIRDIVRNIRTIKTVAEAKAIVSIL